jgi:hypothetical protein
MGLRIIDTDSYEPNNYCNVLNITKAILQITSKIKYHNNIECIDQTNKNICNHMKNLFENSYVIPNPQYTNVVKVLQKSVMNTLNCDKTEISKFKQNITYINYEVIPLFIIVCILYFLFRKYKTN